MLGVKAELGGGSVDDEGPRGWGGEEMSGERGVKISVEKLEKWRFEFRGFENEGYLIHR